MIKKIFIIFLCLISLSSVYASDNFFYIPYTKENINDIYIAEKEEDTPEYLLNFYSSYYPLFVEASNIKYLNLDMVFKNYNWIKNKFLNNLIGYDKEWNVYLWLNDIITPTPIYVEKEWETILKNGDISLYDLLNQKYSLLKEEMLTKYWNENLEYIKKYLGKNDKEECQPLKNITISYNNINSLKLNNFYLKLKKEDMSRYYACLFSDNVYTVNTNTLHTQYLAYRYTNIKKWLDNIHNNIIMPNNDYSIAYNLFAKEWNKKDYVEWDALIYNPKTKKIESKKIGGWWLCGISTIAYQTILQDWKNIDIKQRYPHSQYYQNLYWNNIGLDATIYGWNYKNNKAYKDLIFNNKGKSAILIQSFITKPAKWKFYYGLNLYSLDYKWNETKPSFNKLNKNGNCYFTTVKEVKDNTEVIKYKSCYSLAQ